MSTNVIFFDGDSISIMYPGHILRREMHVNSEFIEYDDFNPITDKCQQKCDEIIESYNLTFKFTQTRITSLYLEICKIKRARPDCTIKVLCDRLYNYFKQEIQEAFRMLQGFVNISDTNNSSKRKRK